MDSCQWSQNLRQHGAVSTSQQPAASLQPATSLQPAASLLSATSLQSNERPAVSKPAHFTSVPRTVNTSSVSKLFQTVTVSRPYYTPTTSRPGHTAAVSRPYNSSTVSRPYNSSTVSRPYYTPTVSRPYSSSTVSRPYHTVTSKTTYAHSASTSTSRPDSTYTLTPHPHPHHTPLTPSHHTSHTSSQRRLFSSSGRERHGETAGEREPSTWQREKVPVSRRKAGPPASSSHMESAASRVTYLRGSSPPKMVTCATQTASSPAYSHTDRHSLAGAHSGTKTWNSGTQTEGGYTFLHSYPELSFSLPRDSSTPRRWTASASPPSQPTGSAIKNYSPVPSLREWKAKPPSSPPLSPSPSSMLWQHNIRTTASSKPSYLHTTTGPTWSSKSPYLHTTTGPPATSSHQGGGTVRRAAPPRLMSDASHYSRPVPQPQLPHYLGGQRSPSSSSSPPQYSSPAQAISSHHLLPWEPSLHSTTGHTHHSHS